MRQPATRPQLPFRPRLFAAAFSLFVCAAALQGQASQLPVAEAQEFLGTWSLEMDFQGNAVQMTLALTDAGGSVAATLESPRQPQPRSITDVTRAGDTLALAWLQDFQGQSIALEMKLKRTAEGLAGTFGDTNGMFSAEVMAALPGGSSPGLSPAASARRQGGGEGDSAAGARRGRAAGGGAATLSLQGKDIRISYPKLEASSDDFAALEALSPGSVQSYVGGGAVKLMSGPDLVFGGPGSTELVAKAGNLAPGYPGVYSLWLLKGEADTWSLVFNEQADIWGTQREAAADVLQITLAHSAAAAPAERMELALEKTGESGGILRITWGSHRWEAAFQAR